MKLTKVSVQKFSFGGSGLFLNSEGEDNETE
jgi:hypothetical protein